MLNLKMCGRCYDIVTEVFPAECGEKPEEQEGAIGQYHCPDCGAMVLASFPHPYLCSQCLEKRHPNFDIPLGDMT